MAKEKALAKKVVMVEVETTLSNADLKREAKTFMTSALQMDPNEKAKVRQVQVDAIEDKR